MAQLEKINYFNLRNRPRISYYEPEEPSFDEYVFCDPCGDFVFEYCAIHGPLLVIPDDKVPSKTGLPWFIPRAALTIPRVFLHLAPSHIPGAGLGVFTTLTLPMGVRFGPYRGEHTDDVTSCYCWQIYDSSRKPLDVIDAVDANRSNWMRYVNCARHCTEQNLVAYQYQGQLFYRTIKLIPKHTELMVFYGSEFAETLNIDLRKYNLEKFYKEVVSINQYIDIYDEHSNYENHSENMDISNDFDATSISNNLILIDEDTHNERDAIETKLAIDKKINRNVYKCEICDKNFMKRSILMKHIRDHKNKNKFKCNLCEFKSHRKHNLNKHLMCIHKVDRSIPKFPNTYEKFQQNKEFICDLCTYKTMKRHNLVKHIKIHYKPKNEITNKIIEKSDKDKKYVCVDCGYKTNKYYLYNYHINKHTETYKYKCDDCAYFTYMKPNLNRHIRKMHKR